MDKCTTLNILAIFTTVESIAYEPLVIQKSAKHEVKNNLFRLQRTAEIVLISLIFGDTAVLIMHYFKDSKISTSLDDHMNYLSSRNQPNTRSKSNLSRLQRVMEIVIFSFILSYDRRTFSSILVTAISTTYDVMEQSFFTCRENRWYFN